MPKLQNPTPSQAPDSNWRIIPVSGPFTAFVGPFYLTETDLLADEPVRFGFRVEDRHCNLRSGCHGGMLATFVDVALARGASHGMENFAGAPTLNMTIDYMSPALIGDWLESRISIMHRARRTVFASCIVMGPRGPVLRGSGIYRMLLKGDETN